jgi:hypothetical protein
MTNYRRVDGGQPSLEIHHGLIVTVERKEMLEMLKSLENIPIPILLFPLVPWLQVSRPQVPLATPQVALAITT